MSLKSLNLFCVSLLLLSISGIAAAQQAAPPVAATAPPAAAPQIAAAPSAIAAPVAAAPPAATSPRVAAVPSTAAAAPSIAAARPVAAPSIVAAPLTAPTPPVAATPPTPDEPTVFSLAFEGGSFLGVHAEEIDRENMSRYGLQREPRGVGITKVVENSPAARAGLREGDVLLKFENEPVTSVRKLNRLISEVAPEHTVRLTISRSGDEKDLNVTLGKRSDFNTAFNFPGQRWEDLDKLRDFKFDDNGRNNNFYFVYGNARRIGVTTTQLTKQLADYFGVSTGRGLLITSVSEDSPAMKAGLRAGDVITEADGQPLETIADLMKALNRQNEGEMSLTITREKSQRTIRLTPERRQGSNFATPGADLAPQAMQSALPRINVSPQMNFVIPKIVIPAMPPIKALVPRDAIPKVRVHIPAKVLVLPSAPL